MGSGRGVEAGGGGGSVIALTILILTTLPFHIFPTPQTHRHHCQKTLIEIKKSLPDPLNILYIWSFNNFHYVCSWTGLSYSHPHLLPLSLNFSSSALSGSIFIAVATLPNLLHLALSNNALSGSIPPALFSLSIPPPLLLQLSRVNKLTVKVLKGVIWAVSRRLGTQRSGSWAREGDRAPEPLCCSVRAYIQ